MDLSAFAVLSSSEVQGSGFLLSFGSSTDALDYRLFIDANSGGYPLCWCASQRGLDACQTPADYAVQAGYLCITGPNVNQESACAVGQACSVTGIRGVGMQAGDRLMILSDCGRGGAIPGIPADGILVTSDGSSFAFSGASDILLSVPGIFRICFCRPLSGSCDAAPSFQARVGLMTASGPFEQTTVCELGSNCTVTVSGIGLDVGDGLFFTAGSCGSSSGLDTKGYPNLQAALLLEDGGANLHVALGELPATANPGLPSSRGGVDCQDSIQSVGAPSHSVRNRPSSVLRQGSYRSIALRAPLRLDRRQA